MNSHSHPFTTDAHGDVPMYDTRFWLRIFALLFPTFCFTLALALGQGCATGGELPSNVSKRLTNSDAREWHEGPPTSVVEDAGTNNFHADSAADSSSDSPAREATMLVTSIDAGSSSETSDATVSDAGSSSVPDAGSSDACAKIVELCNGLDDNCNGLVDEIFLCKLGDTKGPVCVTSCGTAGQRVCEAPTCNWGVCNPFPEDCTNTIDDDCNGLVDCADPACTTDPACDSLVSVTISYTGPATTGFIWLDAWWQPPGKPARPWGKVTACTDIVPDDGKLLCTIALRSGTTSFEFQVHLPDGRFWGDKSFSPTGGKGATIGTVTVSTPKGPLPVTLTPNPSGPPYYNGFIALIL